LPLFNFGVTAEVFYLSSNINSIEFSSPYHCCYGYNSISFINSRQNLEHATFKTYHKDTNYFDKHGTIFSKSLKSLKINDGPESLAEILYFGSIDPIYANLTTLDISTNEMMAY
jgi:hypothetical protein